MLVSATRICVRQETVPLRSLFLQKMPAGLHMSEHIGNLENTISLQAHEAVGALCAVYRLLLSRILNYLGLQELFFFTQVVLPTFILERRSLLEMYADFFAHPDLFVRYLIFKVEH